jgi:MerR family redox-sensitive transcriptional activator SoxR
VPNARDWQKFTDEWRGMLDDRITRLLQLRDQIASCIGCGCLSLEECPLRNPDDVMGEEGAGPRRLKLR